MRISDWSSDVCSSDLGGAIPRPAEVAPRHLRHTGKAAIEFDMVEIPGGHGVEREGAGDRGFHADAVVVAVALQDASRLPGRGAHADMDQAIIGDRSEEHTSELQSLMRSSYAVFCLKKN